MDGNVGELLNRAKISDMRPAHIHYGAKLSLFFQYRATYVQNVSSGDAMVKRLHENNLLCRQKLIHKPHGQSSI
jgi:hypothetical protein